MNPIIAAVLGVLIPFAVAFIVVEVAKANTFVNNLGTPWTQIATILIAAGLSWVSQKLGVVLPTDLAGFNAETITALLTLLVQTLFPVASTLKAGRVAQGLKH